MRGASVSNHLSCAIVVSYDRWEEVGYQLATWLLELEEFDGERIVRVYRRESLNDALGGVEMLHEGFGHGSEDPEDRTYFDELMNRDMHGDYIFTDDMHAAEQLEDLDIYHLAYEWPES